MRWPNSKPSNTIEAPSIDIGEPLDELVPLIELVAEGLAGAIHHPRLDQHPLASAVDKAESDVIAAGYEIHLDHIGRRCVTATAMAAMIATRNAQRARIAAQDAERWAAAEQRNEEQRRWIEAIRNKGDDPMLTPYENMIANDPEALEALDARSEAVHNMRRGISTGGTFGPEGTR